MEHEIIQTLSFYDDEVGEIYVDISDTVQHFFFRLRCGNIKSAWVGYTGTAIIHYEDFSIIANSPYDESLCKAFTPAIVRPVKDYDK